MSAFNSHLGRLRDSSGISSRFQMDAVSGQEASQTGMASST